LCKIQLEKCNSRLHRCRALLRKYGNKHFIRKASLWFAVCGLLPVCSCTKENPEPAPQLIVSAEALDFAHTGETKVFHIKTNVKWTIAVSDAWCEVSPASGDGGGTASVDVSAWANESPSVRSATLTVTAGALSKTVAVTQGGSSFLTVSPVGSISVATEGETIAIEVQASGSFTVKTSAAWITVGQLTGTMQHFAVATNNTVASRQGTITFTLGALTATVTVAQQSTSLHIPADKTGMNNDAAPLVAEMAYGWNIGNTLEAYNGTVPSETAWGNPTVTQQLINSVKAAGFDAIRIPCAWNGYIEDPLTCKIKDAWLARVKEVVDYCVDNEMYAILNIHWDGGWLEENPTYAAQAEVNKKQKALWEQIAVYFRDYGQHLLFAGTNEVHAGYGNPTAENIAVQLSYNQTFVDAVRSTGGKNAWRNLVVQSYNTNIDHAVAHLKMPDDDTPNRLIVEIHYYDPWDFCGESSTGNFTYLWGATFSGTGKSSYGQEDFADAQFGKMKTHFIDRGIPVILGEYGANIRTTSLPTDQMRADNRTSRNNYLRYVTAAAKRAGIVTFWWDAGHIGDASMTLFNRNTGAQVYPDAIEAMMGGM
jgi:endoglucanase